MKMKGLFLAGLLWMAATGMQARGMEHFIAELASQQEVTRVSLGNAAMALGSMFTNTYGVKHIDVLCLEHCSDEVRTKFGQAIADLHDPDFEPLVSHSENGERTKIFVKIKDEMIREMVICHVDDEVAVVRLKGKIKPSDIEQVIQDHGSDR